MKPSTKILMAISGIAFIALGVLCICYPGDTLLSASLAIGLLTLFSGISTIVLWFRTKYVLPTGNLLLSGILQILLGVIFLNHKALLAMTLPIVFAVWLAIEGFILTIRSFDFKKYKFQYWWVMLVVGILLAIAGLVSIRYPFSVAAPALSYSIGACIILFGIVEFVALCGLSKIEKAQ